MRNLLVLSVFLSALSGGSYAVKLPSYFGKPCSRSAPESELSACAERAANMGMASLTNGDKRIKVSSMNPLVVPRVSISQGAGQINLNLTWEPLSIYGVRDCVVSNMRLSWTKKTNEFDVTLPTFSMSGPYKAAGRILLLPITGAGPSNFTFTNLKLHYRFDWPLRKAADGKEYATITNSHIKIIGADGLRSELHGLFNGDKRLGAQMNTFLNVNWRDILKELGPSMVDAAREVVEAVLRNFIASVPIPDMFAP